MKPRSPIHALRAKYRVKTRQTIDELSPWHLHNKNGGFKFRQTLRRISYLKTSMFEHLSHFYPAASGHAAYACPQTSLVVLSVVVAAALSHWHCKWPISPNAPAIKNRQATLIVGLAAWLWYLTMHFIGMFAYQLPAPWRYQGTLTLLSMLPALFCSFGPHCAC